MDTETDPDFGVTIHTLQGDHVSPAYWDRIVTEAEVLGFDILWAGDHITIPAEVPSEYPYDADGDPNSFFDLTQSVYDVFQALTYMASKTEEIRLGPHVCIVPYRRPVVLAKQLLTLEAISECRLEFGAGVGWMSTEFEVLDVPFEERGSRTDEFLELFEKACREGELIFDGLHHSFEKTGFHPRPERESIPVWIGGKSGAAYRRVAKFGDGWATVWDRPAEIRNEQARIMNAWEDYDRDGEPDINITRPIDVGESIATETDRPLVGSPASVIEDIERYLEAGVTSVSIDFFTMDPDEQLRQMRAFSDKVMTQFR